MVSLAPLFQEEGAPAGLEELLQHLLAVSQEAWPTVALAAEPFVRHLRKHCPAGADPLTALPAMHVLDLYLACACAQHHPAALRCLEERYLGDIVRALARGPGDAAAGDELRQRLRERLLVAEGAPCIAAYSGRSSLQRWLRTVARNLLVDAQRQRGAAPVALDDNAAAIEALASDPDPETAFIKERYRQDFYQALRDVFDALPAEQRNLIRLHHLDGLSLDRIGVLLGLHRNAVHRRLEAAREAARRRANQLLRERLRLTQAELLSLVRLVRSQLETHLAAALQTRSTKPPPKP